MVPEQATVIRDGAQQRLLAQDLVPGDLLVLREGDSVPADARLAQAISLVSTESSLTGESLPVHKHSEPIEPTAALGDLLNMVFAGTMIVSGNANAVVTATGMRTEFGTLDTKFPFSLDRCLGIPLNQLCRIPRQERHGRPNSLGPHRAHRRADLLYTSGFVLLA